MAQTTMTCKVTETPREVERIVRRWQGALVELRVSPQATGEAVITITTPAGVETPPDPGLSDLEREVAELRAGIESARHEAATMRAARDASDLEAQAVRDELNAERAVVADLRAQVVAWEADAADAQDWN